MASAAKKVANGVSRDEIVRRISQFSMCAGFDPNDRIWTWYAVKGYDSKNGTVQFCKVGEPCTETDANAFGIWLSSGRLLECPCVTPDGNIILVSA